MVFTAYILHTDEQSGNGTAHSLARARCRRPRALFQAVLSPAHHLRGSGLDGGNNIGCRSVPRSEDTLGGAQCISNQYQRPPARGALG
eukprot:6203454-Pleurochrysis_carterae.AAC.2